MLKIDPPMNVALFIYHDMVHKWYNKLDTTCLLRKERSVRVKKQHHKRTRGKYFCTTTSSTVDKLINVGVEIEAR